MIIYGRNPVREAFRSGKTVENSTLSKANPICSSARFSVLRKTEKSP